MNTTIASTLLPEVQEFLAEETIASFVGGKPIFSDDDVTFATHDPGSGEKLADVHDLEPNDVARAVDVANEAFRKQPWARLAPNERGALLHRLADEIEKRKSIIAQIEALDAGKIESQAQGDVQNFVDTLRYFTDLAQHIQHRTTLAVKGHEAWTVRQPWGACAFIFPWNFPFLLIGWGISPALAAGNTVVIKPAEDTPLSAVYLARLAQEVGIPDGVINVVTGRGETAGAALSANVNIKRMSFTGSPEVGRLVAQSCGHNLVPVKLELGGKGAAVVFDDVDIADIACDNFQFRVCRQVFPVASGEVIDDNDLMSVLQQSVDNVRTDKTGSACYQCFHNSLVFPSLMMCEVLQRHDDHD